MPDAAHLGAFFGAAFVLAVIPGPGMLYVLARSLGGGSRAGMRATAGTAAGGLFHVSAAVLGLSALIAASATAFDLIRLCGAAYLIWLGIRTLRTASEPPPAAGTSRGHTFREGILTEALNPKTALFFLTFLPQFVQPSRGPLAAQLLVLGCAVILLNACSDVIVALLAGRLSRILRRSPRWWTRQRRGSGLLLIGLGGAAAVSGSQR